MTTRISPAGPSWRRAVCSLLLGCTASAFAATGDGGLADPNIDYVGRWDRSAARTSAIRRPPTNW